MSNTSLGLAAKGSKHQMQRITMEVNRQIFDQFIGDEMKWLSPLLTDDFREYQLNNESIMCALGISPSMNKAFFNGFWPSRQPQWDGIAFGTDSCLCLFEAKSHIKEIAPAKEGNDSNNKMKYGAIMQCAKELFGIEETEMNREIWCKKYYQIANRITFAWRMKAIMEAHGAQVTYKAVKMYFLNFVKDTTWPQGKMIESADDWNDHYDNVILSDMGINRQQLEVCGIYIKNFDVTNLMPE